MDDAKSEKMRKENYEELVLSYAAGMSEDSAVEMANMALRGLAREWSGCIACVFSRKYQDSQSYEQPQGDGWMRRGCVLGFGQGKCTAHMQFPKAAAAESVTK